MRFVGTHPRRSPLCLLSIIFVCLAIFVTVSMWMTITELPNLSIHNVFASSQSYVIPRQPELWTILSTQCSPFNDWNSIVVAHSHRRLAIPGRIVRLMSCNEENYIDPKLRYDAYSVRVLPDHDPIDGDVFPPRNKGWNVLDWLVHGLGGEGERPHDDDIIALVDPDQIFVGHLNITRVKHGRGLAAAYAIGTRFLTNAKHYCAGHCDNIADAEAQRYGAPYVLTARDLRHLAPVWVNLTETMRKEKALADEFGWLTEMYTYVLAAIQLGIVHERLDLMISNANDGSEPWAKARWHSLMREPLTFVHFCQAYSLGSYTWRKHDHHDFDIRQCDRSLLFPEPKGEDVKVLKRLDGTPLDAGSDATELTAARQAFMYSRVVPMANDALQAYYEDSCAWTPPRN